MKPEEQRIAIAEACGWILLRDRPSGLHNPVGIDPSDGLTDHIPDYLRDLNAMHEAERILFPKFEIEWHTQVQNACGCSWRVMIRATASQRAEAFLKTLSLWKDDN